MYSSLYELFNYTPIFRGSEMSRTDSVYTDESGTVIEIDTPGSTPDDIEVSAEDGVLDIVWSRKGRGRSSRRYQISKIVDDQKITATVKDGVLTVRLPTRAEARARKIPCLSA